MKPKTLLSLYNGQYTFIERDAPSDKRHKENLSKCVELEKELQKLVDDYNAKAQAANTELADATEIAFAPITTTGFVFLAALWFMLKKKFFI